MARSKKPEAKQKPEKKPDYEVVEHDELGLILVANNEAPLRNARALGGRMPNQLRYIPLPALPHLVDEVEVDGVTVTLVLTDESWHRVVVQ